MHIAAFNIGIVMRSILGAGTPRGIAAKNAASALLFDLLKSHLALVARLMRIFAPIGPLHRRKRSIMGIPIVGVRIALCSTA